MLVVLKRTWFGPNGVRYRAHPGGTVVPETLLEMLPSDAVPLDDKGKPRQKPETAVRPRPRGPTMNYPVDPDLQQATEGMALLAGNNVPQATHTGTLQLDPSWGVPENISSKSQGETSGQPEFNQEIATRQDESAKLAAGRTEKERLELMKGRVSDDSDDQHLDTRKNRSPDKPPLGEEPSDGKKLTPEEQKVTRSIDLDDKKGHSKK